jgi:hypothetical protein
VGDPPEIVCHNDNIGPETFQNLNGLRIEAALIRRVPSAKTGFQMQRALKERMRLPRSNQVQRPIVVNRLTTIRSNHIHAMSAALEFLANVDRNRRNGTTAHRGVVFHLRHQETKMHGT